MAGAVEGEAEVGREIRGYVGGKWIVAPATKVVEDGGFLGRGGREQEDGTLRRGVELEECGDEVW